MQVRFYDIDWDVTDPENQISVAYPQPTLPELPQAVVLEVDNDLDIAEEGADVLSDKYGYCVNSFNFEIIEGAMRQVFLEVQVKVVLNMKEGIDVTEVMNNMDYNFTSCTPNADVEDTEIMDWEVKDSK